MNNWEKTIEFFNKYQKSTREQFYNYIGSKKINYYGTLDTYRNNLKNAGFLETVDRGMYKRIRKIPNDLSISQCLSITKQAHEKEKLLQEEIRVREEKLKEEERIRRIEMDRKYVIKNRLDMIQ